MGTAVERAHIARGICIREGHDRQDERDGRAGRKQRKSRVRNVKCKRSGVVRARVDKAGEITGLRCVGVRIRVRDRDRCWMINEEGERSSASGIRPSIGKYP